MYSVVLMMALTTGVETPEHGGRRGGGCNGGGYGCSGYGGGSGCFGRGGYGCAGGGYGCNGGFGGRRHRRGGRCCGNGGGYGCAGYGGYGCAGSGGYGSPGFGGYGCAGSGGYGCPGTPAPVPTPPPPPAPGGTDKMPTDARGVAPATIIVTLPADARLTVDGNATTSTSGRRVLVTPALDVGSEYVYNLTASIVVDGQTVTETKTVAVRGGRTTEVPFSFATSVASR